MPNSIKHLSIIEQNYKTLVHLTQSVPSNYSDWCVTIIFYMALHYVHAFLSEELAEHPNDHQSLQSIIVSNTQLKAIYQKYRNLQDDSREARYNGEKFETYVAYL